MRTLARYHFDSGLAIFLLIILLLHFSHIWSNYSSVILVTTAFIGLTPVLWSAILSLRAREWASMDLLASIALIFSLLSQEWTSAVFIELMLAAARILDDVTRDRTEKSIRGLLKLRPENATIERQGQPTSVPLATVQVNDIVLIDLGQRIPVDGIVISGTAAVDESSLTGESTPVDKQTGDRVMSSTLIQSGSLRIRTTHIGSDTTLEKVISLVESARQEKPSSQTLGERFGKFYLITIFAGSFIFYAITHNLLLVLAIVLVVCADDIAIAIPIAYLRAIRAAANHGIIIKGGKHLELLGNLRTIVFDKTGTLTTGSLAVTKIIPDSNYTPSDIIKWSIIVNARSSHPFSRAIINYAKANGHTITFPKQVEEKGGKGIIAHLDQNVIVTGKQSFFAELNLEISPALLESAHKTSALGNSVSYLALNQTVIGFIAAADQIKPNAKTALDTLRTLGIQKIVMLTGDNDRVAASVARQLSIDEWHADLLPQDKVNIIRRLQSEQSLAMVGDGVNDAAALSIASVGIAMGGLGTEGTIESAQIVLMRDDLSALPTAIQLARRARIISLQDFWIWGCTNAIGLAFVFGGLIGPAGAAAYNFLSDFLPLSNSFRVRAQAKPNITTNSDRA